MATASYNLGGGDGLTEIVPTTSGYIEAAVVLTTAVEPQARAMRYAFPGVPGAGSVHFGLAPGVIVWDWWLEVASMANLKAFENLLRVYRGAGRFVLQSEQDGLSWPNVELADYRPNYPIDTVAGSGNLLRTGRVLFRWMQPGVMA